MTGGVGTTFYRAPEQEGTTTGRNKSDSSSYTVQADIFSFGVVLFEMFRAAPFSTYMERAETLTTVRGDKPAGPQAAQGQDGRRRSDSGENFKERARRRFPSSFVETVPDNAQRMILWCLERDPKKRPSAEELLSSELLPRKIELEQRYLEEALELLTSSQSESYLEILRALFGRPTPDVVDLTFDTDIAARANNYVHTHGGKRFASPSEELVHAIGEIRAGAINPSSLRSLAMNSSSLIAATSALKRARNAGRLGKGGKGMLKRSTQRTAGILAMRAATAAAVTGALDGVHGADPAVVEKICEHLKLVFQSHGAVHLRSPLLRPRPNPILEQTVGGPAEIINERGNVLFLPEDLTAPFGKFFFGRMSGEYPCLMQYPCLMPLVYSIF
jgi:translation initiation factor 2-alpha kinase 4